LQSLSPIWTKWDIRSTLMNASRTLKEKSTPSKTTRFCTETNLGSTTSVRKRASTPTSPLTVLP
jgi:hypothetical protein